MIRNKNIFTFFLILSSCLSFLLFPKVSLTAENESTEALRLLKFANELYKEGDYYRAITEYKRFISYYPKAEEIPDAEIGIANSYYKAEKYEEAIDRYRDFLSKYPKNKRLEEAILNIADSFIKTKKEESALKLLKEVEETMPNSSILEKLKILLGKHNLMEGNLNAAEKHLKSVKKESIEGKEAEKLLESIKGVRKLKLKSPALAGIMSAILPGSGQIYAGRKKDALFSFLLNGLFAWGAVESFNRDIYVAGAILSFFEFGWYTGNIYNAVSDTYKYNKNLKTEYLKENLSYKMRETNF
ncbi:MAG: outer membrane protein assembly factor BamD, partial [Candidatus Schekmanbacteria bacterium]